ncbi:YozE family protein [Streptomyces sp. L2]|uniref:YozE family protein n=1 Tax=Streptomyces sp. L2 TaxID=2162665 RepID=UPI0010129981|nr:YozE family protein [Streptomyces sp. L2]
MPTAKSFTAWLKTQTDRESGIGDLARDVSNDPDWPSRKGQSGQRAYLEERGAIPAAIEMFEDAWVRYEAYRAQSGDA